MAVDAPGDWSVFLGDDFAEVVTVAPQSGALTFTVNAIWLDPDSVVAAGAWPGVSSGAPVLSIAEIHLPAPLVRGDVIAARGVNWRVADLKSDGAGLVRAAIERA